MQKQLASTGWKEEETASEGEKVKKKKEGQGKGRRKEGKEKRLLFQILNIGQKEIVWY